MSLQDRRAERRARRERGDAGRPVRQEPEPEPRQRMDFVGAELDELFGPSRKHIHERKEWVAVAKIDYYEAGDGPIDLDSGKVQLNVPAQPADQVPTDQR